MNDEVLFTVQVVFPDGFIASEVTCPITMIGHYTQHYLYVYSGKISRKEAEIKVLCK